MSNNSTPIILRKQKLFFSSNNNSVIQQPNRSAQSISATPPSNAPSKKHRHQQHQNLNSSFTAQENKHCLSSNIKSNIIHPNKIQQSPKIETLLKSKREKMRQTNRRASMVEGIKSESDYKQEGNNNKQIGNNHEDNNHDDNVKYWINKDPHTMTTEELKTWLNEHNIKYNVFDHNKQNFIDLVLNYSTTQDDANGCSNYVPFTENNLVISPVKCVKKIISNNCMSTNVSANGPIISNITAENNTTAPTNVSVPASRAHLLITPELVRNSSKQSLDQHRKEQIKNEILNYLNDENNGIFRKRPSGNHFMFGENNCRTNNGMTCNDPNNNVCAMSDCNGNMHHYNNDNLEVDSQFNNKQNNHTNYPLFSTSYQHIFSSTQTVSNHSLYQQHLLSSNMNVNNFKIQGQFQDQFWNPHAAAMNRNLNNTQFAVFSKWLYIIFCVMVITLLQLMYVGNRDQMINTNDKNNIAFEMCNINNTSEMYYCDNNITNSRKFEKYFHNKLNYERYSMDDVENRMSHSKKKYILNKKHFKLDHDNVRIDGNNLQYNRSSNTFKKYEFKDYVANKFNQKQLKSLINVEIPKLLSKFFTTLKTKYFNNSS